MPAEILSRPGLLTEMEFNLLKTHAQVGYDILQPIEFPWPVAKIVHQHHERLDGSGYPLGLKGEEILLEARILAVADVVEAMSLPRPFRSAHGIEKALQEIGDKKGVLYDTKVVDACLKVFSDEEFAFEQPKNKEALTVGERLNSSRASVARALRQRDAELIQREARVMVAARAHYLSVSATRPVRRGDGALAVARGHRPGRGGLPAVLGQPRLKCDGCCHSSPPRAGAARLHHRRKTQVRQAAAAGGRIQRREYEPPILSRAADGNVFPYP